MLYWKNLIWRTLLEKNKYGDTKRNWSTSLWFVYVLFFKMAHLITYFYYDGLKALTDKNVLDFIFFISVMMGSKHWHIKKVIRIPQSLRIIYMTCAVLFFSWVAWMAGLGSGGRVCLKGIPLRHVRNSRFTKASLKSWAYVNKWVTILSFAYRSIPTWPSIVRGQPTTILPITYGTLVSSTP